MSDKSSRFELAGVCVQGVDGYQAKRRACLRCGTILDENERCPACFERDGAGKSAPEGRG